MADFVQHTPLYQETLDTALNEVQELSSEIERLRELLDQLERRKKAVEDVCNAIQRWVEISTPSGEIDNRLSLPLESQTGTVSLTEEEVSLIAYTHGIAGES